MYLRTLLLTVGLSICGASALAQNNSVKSLDALIQEGSPDACVLTIEVLSRGAEKIAELSQDLKLHQVLFKGALLETKLTRQSKPETCDALAKEFGKSPEEEWPVLFRTTDEAKMAIPARIEVFAQVVPGFVYYGIPSMIYFIFLKQL